jgi:acyl dehydratase
MPALKINQRASISRAFTIENVAEYRALTGDVDLGYGADATRATVPGPLLGGMFSFLLGTQMPGPGTNWLKQELVFPLPALVGQTLTATVTVTRLRVEKDLVNLRTTCTNSAGETVCDGEALVLVKDLTRQ